MEKMIDIVLQFSKYDVSGVDLVSVDHVDVVVEFYDCISIVGVDLVTGVYMMLNSKMVLLALILLLVLMFLQVT